MFPARAGMNRMIRSPGSNPPSVPRASGDEPSVTENAAMGVTCSPRERG